jgi:hypothetical protein
MVCTCVCIGTVTGIDIVEVNPELGTPQEQAQSIDMTLEIVSALFGKGRNGYLDPSYVLPKVNNPRSKSAALQQYMQQAQQSATLATG